MSRYQGAQCLSMVDAKEMQTTLTKWRTAKKCVVNKTFLQHKKLKDRESQSQRDRETERQRDRETERQRDRETERQRDRETERQRDRETERQRDKEIESQEKQKDIVPIFLLFQGGTNQGKENFLPENSFYRPTPKFLDN